MLAPRTGASRPWMRKNNGKSHARGAEAFPMKSAVFRKTANSLQKPAARAATRPTANGTRGKTRTNPLLPSNLKYQWVIRPYSRVRLCSPGPIMPDEPSLAEAARCAPAAMDSKLPLTPSSASNVPLEMPK
jgi:hypothetical protein